MKLLIIATALLTSCGYASDYMTNQVGLKKQFNGVADELKPYVAEFNKACDVPPIIRIPAGFGRLPEGTAGVCNEWRVGNMDYEEITIDRESWDRMGPAQRRHLVFHELGHCLLNRDHDNTMLDKNKPKSIMIESVPSNAAELWYLWKDYYINELCGEQP